MIHCPLGMNVMCSSPRLKLSWAEALPGIVMAKAARAKVNINREIDTVMSGLFVSC